MKINTNSVYAQLTMLSTVLGQVVLMPSRLQHSSHPWVVSFVSNIAIVTEC